jgi:hypothetical protein
VSFQVFPVVRLPIRCNLERTVSDPSPLEILAALRSCLRYSNSRSDSGCTVHSRRPEVLVSRHLSSCDDGKGATPLRALVQERQVFLHRDLSWHLSEKFLLRFSGRRGSVRL